MASTPFPVGRVIVIAGLLGAVLGVGIGLWREARASNELDRIESAPERLSLDEFPPGEAPPAQSGAVKLAAVEGLPQYPGAFVRPVTSGENINVAWFETKDDVDQVLSFYEKEFREQGKLPVSYQYSEFTGYAGYMELDTHRMHVISVIRQNGQTMVFPSTSWPERMLKDQAAVPPGMPAVAGVEGNAAFDLGGAGRQVWLGNFPSRSTAELVREWRDGLVTKGWIVRDASENVLEASRDGAATVQVSVKGHAVYVSMAMPGAGS